MANILNFNTLKKQTMTVVLPDENNTKLLICTPTKGVLDSFLNMKDSLSEESLGDNALDELYDLVSKIMSRNKAGIKITKEKVSEIFDFEDIIIFIQAYTKFISEVTNQKN